MDLTAITFPALATIGVVNVATFFWPNLDTRIKFVISLAVAVALSFVPETIQNDLLARSLDGINIALVATGGYKIAQKIGGK